MTQAAILIIVVGTAVIGLVWLLRRSAGGMPGIVDRSIGMYIFRLLTGRSTGRPVEPRPTETPALTAAEVAYRIGAAGAARAERAFVAREPGPLAAPTADPRRPAYPAEPVGPRARLARDAAVALVGLTAIGLVASFVSSGAASAIVRRPPS